MLQDVDKYAPETEVHKYLHSRLACFDTATLYELHYQMITLGKVSGTNLPALRIHTGDQTSEDMGTAATVTQSSACSA